MARHELLDPPQAGIGLRPPEDSVCYASRGRTGEQILGWIRVRIIEGLLTFEQAA